MVQHERFFHFQGVLGFGVLYSGAFYGHELFMTIKYTVDSSLIYFYNCHVVAIKFGIQAIHPSFLVHAKGCPGLCLLILSSSYMHSDGCFDQVCF